MKNYADLKILYDEYSKNQEKLIKSGIAEQFTKNRDCLGKIRTVGMFNNISSTSCLLVDTGSFDRLFMCKLYRKNKWHKIYLCITLKKIEIMVIIINIIIIMIIIIIITILIIKLEDAYFISFFGWSYLNIAYDLKYIYF